MNRDSDYIFTLIAAFLCGEELTSAEKQELEHWKEASDGNQELYRYYQTIFKKRTELVQWENVQLPSDVYNRVFSSPAVKAKRVRSIWKYAAVMIPALILSVWFLSRKMPEAVLVVAQPEMHQDVAPGKQKAQLLLDNGEVVSLSDSSVMIESHKNIQVADGGILQYTRNDQPAQQKAVYHTLVVDRGAEFQLILPDGTKVWLNSDSELKYPNIFNEDLRQVYLKGEAYFEVKHAEEHPFVVHAGECAIRVLGTAFNVSSYEGEKEIVTTLVKGRVAYTAGKQQGELIPGEQCVYERDAKIVQIQKVDVNQFISWKNGLFVFDHISMEELAKQISRWYDIEVIFPDQSARKISFTGAMERYKPVSYLLQILNETNTVDCRLEGGMLVFRPK